MSTVQGPSSPPVRAESLPDGAATRVMVLLRECPDDKVTPPPLQYICTTLYVIERCKGQSVANSREEAGSPPFGAQRWSAARYPYPTVGIHLLGAAPGDEPCGHPPGPLPLGNAFSELWVSRRLRPCCGSSAPCHSVTTVHPVWRQW